MVSETVVHLHQLILHHGICYIFTDTTATTIHLFHLLALYSGTGSDVLPLPVSSASPEDQSSSSTGSNTEKQII